MIANWLRSTSRPSHPFRSSIDASATAANDGSSGAAQGDVSAAAGDALSRPGAGDSSPTARADALSPCDGADVAAVSGPRVATQSRRRSSDLRFRCDLARLGLLSLQFVSYPASERGTV